MKGSGLRGLLAAIGLTAAVASAGAAAVLAAGNGAAARFHVTATFEATCSDPIRAAASA
jgi:hypothetical protein